MANAYSRLPSFLQDILSRKCASQIVSQSIIWSFINSALLSVLIFDLYYGGFSTDSLILWWIVVGLCFLCIINICHHLKSYLIPIVFFDAITLNDKQRKLLSISRNDLSFKSRASVTNSPKSRTEQSPKLSQLFEANIRTPITQHVGQCGVSDMSKAWYTSPLSSLPSSFSPSRESALGNLPFNHAYELNQSPNISLSTTSDSWSFRKGLSLTPQDSSFCRILADSSNNTSQLNDSYANAFASSCNSTGHSLTSSPLAFGSSPRRFSITTKEELDEYLKDFQEKEFKKQILLESDGDADASKSLWAFNSSVNLSFNFLSSLKDLVYQCASKDSDVSANLSKSEGASVTNFTSGSVSRVWLKRHVTPKDLFQFEENLRIWLAMNILRPLAQLIESCNKTLTAVAPELQIGKVGVEKLRKAAQNITGVKHLNYLLPFLDLTLHQDYLIQRLIELSKGGAISAFKWASGSSFNGHAWREEYPTDSSILLHMFSMYMDHHLPPDPTQPDGRVFSNVHVVKTPEKPPAHTNVPLIYFNQMNPPHLKVILPPNQECELGSGHKNFLHCMILFCHYVVFEKCSQIAGVDLKLSGINLAWVVNAE